MTNIFLEDIQFQLKGKTEKQLNRLILEEKKSYFMMKLHLQKCYRNFVSSIKYICLIEGRDSFFSPWSWNIHHIWRESMLLQMQYSVCTQNIASKKLIKACFESISMMDVYIFYNENILWRIISSVCTTVNWSMENLQWFWKMQGYFILPFP